jgi:hypothetical protein
MQGNRGKIRQQWCEHVQKSVETRHEGKINMLGKQKVQTDRDSPHVKCKKSKVIPIIKITSAAATV